MEPVVTATDQVSGAQEHLRSGVSQALVLNSMDVLIATMGQCWKVQVGHSQRAAKNLLVLCVPRDARIDSFLRFPSAAREPLCQIQPLTYQKKS